VIVLAATNRKELIDPAIRRPGRVDFTLEFPNPDEKTREQIFKVHTKRKPLAEDVDIALLAKETEGFVGSDIEAISREASMAAIREYLKDKTTKKELDIKMEHFKAAIVSLKSQRGASNPVDTGGEHGKRR